MAVRDPVPHDGLVISTSDPMPTKGSEEDKDVQPPHRQGACRAPVAGGAATRGSRITRAAVLATGRCNHFVSLWARGVIARGNPPVGGLFAVIRHPAPTAEMGL